MLVIQFGMMGSASSWAFRLCQAMAEHMGSRQKPLLTKLDMGPVPWSAIAGAPMQRAHPNPWDLNQVLERLGAGEIFVMKTHSAPPTDLIGPLTTGEIRTVMTTRDPFDCAASLMDKGEKARAAGTKEFSHIQNFEQALKIARYEVLKAARWRLFPGVLELPYKFVRSYPDACASLVANHIGFDGELQPILDELGIKRPNFSTGQENCGYSQVTPADIESFVQDLLRP